MEDAQEEHSSCQHKGTGRAQQLSAAQLITVTWRHTAHHHLTHVVAVVLIVVGVGMAVALAVVVAV